MIYIPKMPHNVVAITTNSSSELFVIGKDVKINQVEKMIDEKGWRWWFGEKKRLNNKEEILEFVKKYSFVFEYLFPKMKDLPPKSYYWGNEPKPLPLVGVYEDIGKLEKELYHSSLKQDAKRCDELRSELALRRDLETNIIEALMDDWLKRQDIDSFKGIHYYECREDNELNDWEKVHATIPGNYARLG